mgnify:CR=1 FL=1
MELNDIGNVQYPLLPELNVPHCYFEQWGFRSDTGYGGRTVTFPIAFTKQCFNGHVTTKRGGDSSNGNNYVDNLTTTNMWTVCDGGGGYWIAIGY